MFYPKILQGTYSHPHPLAFSLPHVPQAAKLQRPGCLPVWKKKENKKIVCKNDRSRVISAVASFSRRRSPKCAFIFPLLHGKIQLQIYNQQRKSSYKFLLKVQSCFVDCRTVIFVSTLVSCFQHNSKNKNSNIQLHYHAILPF